jgi:hypothetical protein
MLVEQTQKEIPHGTDSVARHRWHRWILDWETGQEVAVPRTLMTDPALYTPDPKRST